MDKKKHCLGCDNNFYNGNNPYGVKECWSLANAELIMRKEVSINDVPPWKQKARKFLNCYRRKGYCYIDPERMF